MRFSALTLALLAGFSVIAVAAEALAQAPAPIEVQFDDSFLLWLLKVGGLCGALIMLTGLAIFVGSCLVVAKTRRPAVVASCLVFLVLPLLIAMIELLRGWVAAFSVVAVIGEPLKASVIATAEARVLLLPLEAFCVTLPSLLVLAISLFARTLRAERQPDASDRAE
jgi:hypothetical protein